MLSSESSTLRTNRTSKVEKSGSSLFSVGTFSLAQDGPVSDPQMTQITTDFFLSSTHLLILCLEICGS